MEVGTEISQKIRSAIKAKLLELGAYVDDELPDYIMVMVANKKSRAQMTKDLCLFLGGNTDAFTEWLHSLLAKLQTIRVDSDKAADKQNTGDKSKSKEKKKTAKDKSPKGGDGCKSKDKKKIRKHSTDLTTKRKVTSTDGSEEQDQASAGHTGGNINLAETAAEPETGGDNSGLLQKQIKDKSKGSHEDVEDVRQLLVTASPGDELAEELETTEVDIVNSQTEKNIAKVAATELNSDNNKTIATASEVGHGAQSSIVPRKRKAPSSVVASVSRKNDEEEYDPYNPAVGSVASVVKVTSRKPSVPPSLQANRALLVKAMSEAERSIAVKRKVGVTKPMSRDDSPSDVYTPKRKRSADTKEEASPPPYIPSRKAVAESFSQTSANAQRGEQRQLSRHDIRHTLSQEDRRELISKSRREELLRTIGIDREHHRKSNLSLSPEQNRSHSGRDKGVLYSREVRADANSSEVKNFQITARVMSSGSKPAVQPDRERQHSPSPESKPSPQASRSSSFHSDSKTSVTARLGKVVLERKDVSKPKDAREEINNRIALSRSNTDQRDVQRDAREDIRAKLLKSKENVLTGSRVRGVISRIGKEFVQKQCEAAVLSVQTSRHSDRHKVSASLDSRVVHCDEETSHSAESDRDDDTISYKHKRPVVRKELEKEVPEFLVKDRNSDDDDDDEAEDLSKMIDDDIEPDLLDVTHTDEFTLDLDDDNISNVVGALEEEAVAAADLQEAEKDQESKPGTRFIVTLDGVDEREFELDNNNSVFDKFRRPPLASASASVAPVVATSADQVQQNHKLFLDLLASQGRPLPHSQILAQSQTAPSKHTPPKIQPFSISLKDSDDEPDDKESKAAAMGAGSSYYVRQEEESGFSAVKRAKMSERCKFWPACMAGTACEYHHPTTHCKTFPNCKFGDKCLFIHPNCRFDSKCARPDCPYTHTSRRTKISSAAHVIAIPSPHVLFSPAPPKPHYSSYLTSGYPTTTQPPPCRFFPNCHNMNCPFTHPKPCRFGMACKNAGCPFYHPPTPGKDKLKWQAQASQSKVEEVSPSLRGSVTVKQHADSLTSSASHSTTVSSTSQ